MDANPTALKKKVAGVISLELEIDEFVGGLQIGV